MELLGCDRYLKSPAFVSRSSAGISAALVVFGHQLPAGLEVEDVFRTGLRNDDGLGRGFGGLAMLDDQRSTVARLVKVTFAGAAKAEQGHNTRTSGHLSVFGDWRIP